MDAWINFIKNNDNVRREFLALEPKVNYFWLEGRTIWATGLKYVAGVGQYQMMQPETRS
jgi:hypothetical protein